MESSRNFWCICSGVSGRNFAELSSVALWVVGNCLECLRKILRLSVNVPERGDVSSTIRSIPEFRATRNFARQRCPNQRGVSYWGEQRWYLRIWVGAFNVAPPLKNLWLFHARILCQKGRRTYETDVDRDLCDGSYVRLLCRFCLYIYFFEFCNKS